MTKADPQAIVEARRSGKLGLSIREKKGAFLKRVFSNLKYWKLFYHFDGGVTGVLQSIFVSVKIIE